ncbi:MAG: PHP domain-containing protein [Thermodesulfobacteriota bacterium]
MVPEAKETLTRNLIDFQGHVNNNCRMIDLHIHTIASSDGQHTPEEIFALAGSHGLKAIAFADHNSVGSVPEGVRLGKETGIELVPAIEINTFYADLDLHLLAYFIDYEGTSIQDWLATIRVEKEKQALQRIARLQESGFVLTEEDVRRHSGGKIPTGYSYLKAILDRKENKDDPRLRTYTEGNSARSPYYQFYHDWLKGGRPAYVPIKVLATPGVIRQVLEWKAIPVLAHPMDTPDTAIMVLIGAGLMGLEVYNSYHSAEQVKHFEAIAGEHNLLMTSGSDFHGRKMKPDIEMGRLRGNDMSLLDALKAAKACLDADS